VVQALAFAEIFLGLILADAGYKGVTLSAVVKGEAEGAEPKGLTSGSPTTVLSPSAAGSTVPGGSGVGDVTGETEAQAIAKGELLPAAVGEAFSTREMNTPTQAFGQGEYERNAAFGPQPINSPNSLFGSAGASP
jgi:hypothetical protein